MKLAWPFCVCAGFVFVLGLVVRRIQKKGETSHPAPARPLARPAQSLSNTRLFYVPVRYPCVTTVDGKRERRTFSSRSPEASRRPSGERARQVPTDAVCPSRWAERLMM